jgi:murein L,D-transpeptidase YcbB/YkuD
MCRLILLLLLCCGPALACASTAELVPVLEALVNLNARVMTAPKASITRVDSGSALKKGSKGKRAAQLNQRLAELGYPTTAGAEHFDQQTDVAVRAFQSAMGGVVDGIVDEHTLFNLNLSDREKIAILRGQFAEMERLFAENEGRRFVVVNVPAYKLAAFEEGRRVVESRIIVGKPVRQTPMMKTALTGIVFNPTWSPPPTILAKDIFRAGEIDLRTVGKLGLKLIDERGQAASLDSVVAQGDFAEMGYRFIQPAGDRNALGRLKFDLDNPLSIYLHDTNHRELFDRNTRALSSGCIRVDRFRELAAWVLGAARDVDRELQDRRTRRTSVEHLPVYTVYWLADVTGDKVVFHRDIYGRTGSRKRIE